MQKSAGRNSSRSDTVTILSKRQFGNLHQAYNTENGQITTFNTMTLFELYQSASTATLTNIEQEVQSIQLNNRWNVSGLTLACLYEATGPTP